MVRDRNILIFVPHLYFGGVSTVLLRLLTGLVKSYYNVHIVVGAADSALIVSLQEINGLKITVLNVIRSRNAIGLLRAILVRGHYDVVMGVQSHGAWVLALAAFFSLYRGKVVSWEHTTPSKAFIQQSIINKVFLSLVRVLYRRIDKIFAVSSGVAKDVQEIYDIEQDRIQILPSPIYSESANRVKKHKTDQLHFLFVGRLSHEKGVYDILQAFNKLGCDSWTLSIVGSGQDEGMLKSYVNDNERLRKRVVFAGYYRDVTSWYIKSDVLILASYYEGLPTVLVEASVFGLPLIATDCESGPNEIVIPNKNGLLVPVGNYQMLSNAIKKMIVNFDDFDNNETFVISYRDDIAVEKFIRAFDDVIVGRRMDESSY
ncbi:MAG: glycosyltransferase [Agitococcus sp.]|nr:glycosyltransferase [Agitococcus sp.]